MVDVSTCKHTKILRQWNRFQNVPFPRNFHCLLKFHVDFESIHPFQDGNGRVGRLLLFKECLNHNIIPFIIDHEHKLFYYRGLHEFYREPGYLTDNCLSAQDKYIAYCRHLVKDFA
ncbi:MAG: Fic family protein [Selenomonas sp.]|nr:Fic family protein [Selenomonas sp.]